MTRTSPRTGADRPQDTVDGLERASGTTGTGKCETCLKKLKPGRHGERKRVCSLQGRQLGWAVRILTAAVAAGKADGLKDRIGRLKP